MLLIVINDAIMLCHSLYQCVVYTVKSALTENMDYVCFVIHKVLSGIQYSNRGWRFL